METKIPLLIVDDEVSIREFLEIMLKRDGYEVTTASSALEAIKVLEKKRFPVVVSDISMPDMNGIELLSKIKQLHSDCAVIIMTAFGSTESAVEAMKLGANDYLTKPFQIDEMKLAVKSALRSIELEKENRQLRSELGKSFSFESIIGNSPSMQSIFDLIKRVANTKTNVMILGESGTGKELIAHAIHRHSASPEAPFCVINCAAIPEQLLESELFGYKKGAFTGANTDKKGIFEAADGGTLFLDEIGDLPQNFQVKLLRAIQQKSFRPVGGTADIQVDVRFICATNKDLEQEVKQGKFREDLFYRLNVIQVRMPPLRERKEDIPHLANHFVTKFSLAMGKNVKTVSKEALEILLRHEYPGNVRELENIIERAVALETKSSVFPESLPPQLLLKQGTSSSAVAAGQATSFATSPETKLESFDLEKGVEEFERQHIQKALEAAGYVKKKAAEILGISFRSLRYRIEKYKIDDPNPEEKE